MTWEYVGQQELQSREMRHTYILEMWRTKVPGGWLVISLNSRSTSPDPTTVFYPDPLHEWHPEAPPEAAYLLRAASSVSTISDKELLHPSIEGSKQRLLEPQFDDTKEEERGEEEN